MDGSSFSVMVSNLTSSITSSNAVLTVSDDTVDPLLLSVGSPDGVTVGVCFNELVDSESAEDPFNYAINGSLVVATARVRPDGRSVRLTLTAPITGVFTLEVNDVRDLAGNSVAINSTANGVVAGLTSADIGLPIATGSIYSCTNGDFEVIAGGDGLSGPDDQGHFALKSVTGDFDVKVRVLGIPNSQGAAGLVLRESFQAGTQSIHLLANSSPPPNALGFIRTGQRMFVDGGIRSWGSGYSFETRPDVWLRLRRTSDLYTRFYSTNGTDWILIESLALDLSPQALVGLAATANDDEAPAVLAHLRNFGEMTFSNPSLHLGENPADTTVPQNTDVNFSAHAAGSGAPDSELVYQWQRGDGSGSFTNVIGANSPTFGIFARPQDHGAIFRVRVHLAGLVMDSQVATLTLTPDVTLPRIQSVVAPGQGNQVNVTFSEAVAAASGTNLLHYAITNLSTGLRVGITSVSQSPDGRTITLLTDLLAEGPSYEITVGGVEDLGDPPNTILSGTRAEFRHDSLVGYWQFEEGTGTTTADASGNGFTGTLVNGPTWVAGAAGRHALEFDGSNDRVDLGNPEVLQITGPLTLAAWVYPDSTTDNGRIITKGGGPGQRGWALNVEGINAWSFQIAVSGSANISVLVTNVPLRRWTHVAGVYDPSVPSLRLYTNGVLGGEVTAGVPTSQFNPPLNVSIGARPIQQTFFDGKIDEVRVHARALGAPQIAGLARPLFLPAVILGNQIQLDWVGVGRLEQAPAMSGPWTPIMPAPVAPYVEVVVPTVNRFFRLNATP
jgi:hypothetical protein